MLRENKSRIPYSVRDCGRKINAESAPITDALSQNRRRTGLLSATELPTAGLHAAALGELQDLRLEGVDLRLLHGEDLVLRLQPRPHELIERRRKRPDRGAEDSDPGEDPPDWDLDYIGSKDVHLVA